MKRRLQAILLAILGGLLCVAIVWFNWRVYFLEIGGGEFAISACFVAVCLQLLVIFLMDRRV